MIELKFTGICEDCLHADLHLRQLSSGKWIVCCTHNLACSRIDTLIREENSDGSDYQKKVESDEEKIDKERARRILERRKMCIEKVVSDVCCPDDCSLCNFCVTDKALASVLEYAINYLKEE